MQQSPTNNLPRGQVLGVHGQAHDVVQVVPSSAVHIQPHLVSMRQQKRLSTAYMYGLPLGILGAHHFYLGRPKFGVLYLFTLGMVGIGWALDLIRMPCLVREVNQRRADPMAFKKKKSTLDAYLLWMPFGLLGFHQYYLKRYEWGLAYTFTFGFCGIGWLLDGFRMYSLVERTNERLLSGRMEEDEKDSGKVLSDAYILAASPFGLLGAHQYYMERWMFGIIYTFTLALFGAGWLVDMLTMPAQFKRAMRIRRHEIDPRLRYKDEAYKLLFPLGFLGLHHFYLRRPAWGILYMLTFGVLYMGCIIDFFRLPALVDEANRRAKEELDNMVEIQEKLGPGVHVVNVPPGYTVTPVVTPDGDAINDSSVRQGAQYFVHQTGHTGDQPNFMEQPPPYNAVVNQVQMSSIAEVEEEEEEEENRINHAYHNQAFQQNFVSNTGKATSGL